MRPVRIGKIAGDQQQVGTLRLQQRAHDCHVSGADRVLPHGAGSIEREVEKAGVGAAKAQRLDATHRLGFADDPLDVLYFLDVHVARSLGVQERLDPFAQRLNLPAVEAPAGREPRQYVDVAPHVVVEDGDAAARHVGDVHAVAVEVQLVQQSARGNHVIVGMWREADHRPVPGQLRTAANRARRAH